MEDFIHLIITYWLNVYLVKSQTRNKFLIGLFNTHLFVHLFNKYLLRNITYHTFLMLGKQNLTKIGKIPALLEVTSGSTSCCPYWAWLWSLQGDAAIMLYYVVHYSFSAIVIKEGLVSENEHKGEFSPTLLSVVMCCLLEVLLGGYIFNFLIGPG